MPKLRLAGIPQRRRTVYILSVTGILYIPPRTHHGGSLCVSVLLITVHKVEKEDKVEAIPHDDGNERETPNPSAWKSHQDRQDHVEDVHGEEIGEENMFI